jgi:hypothetical protein
MSTIRLLILIILAISSAKLHAQDGIYLWKSEIVQDEKSQKNLFKNLQKHAITRLYLGLNARQVKDAVTFKRDMGGLFLTAQKAGVEVWLLLGDPGWLSPAERPKLTRIVKRFESLPFEGVMLDLEVEQVAFPASPSLLVQWVDTVESVIASTQKPVSIATHWRWFSSDSPVCMSCEFTRIGVRDISLMIYTTNIDRATEVAQNTASVSGLPVRIAQSIEPSLDSSESWARVPIDVRKARISKLKGLLMATPIDWQAYEFINHLD